mgnify:CR=1 FL=1
MESISERHVVNGKNQILLILSLTILTIGFAFFAMGFGSSSQLDMFSTMGIIFDLDAFSCLPFEKFPCTDDLQSQIVWNLRFPRILMAIITGIALATAGALMQGCLGNPLVSPLTLGVASGAALGAAFAIVLGFSIIAIPELAIVANAFLFSLIVVGIIIQLGNMRSVSAESYILVGIAITFIAGAIVSTMTYFATDAQLSQLAHWSFGSLSRPDLEVTFFIGISILLLMPLAFIWAWDLNTLSLGGDEFAISTGVDPISIRRNILVVSALMTSIVISFTGLIGFVGLAAPHMSRLIIGNDYRKLIPCSAVFGALLVLFADTLGRTLFAPIVIPVGIMLSIIGGPFFMYLLLRNRGGTH